MSELSKAERAFFYMFNMATSHEGEGTRAFHGGHDSETSGCSTLLTSAFKQNQQKENAISYHYSIFESFQSY
jgi:hypothetical protein